MFVQIVCILLAIIAGAIIDWYVNYNKWVKRIKGIRGPTAIPILGNALEFKGRKTLLDDMSRLFRIYGNIAYVMVGYEPMVFVADYDVFEKILNSTIIVDKAPSYRFLTNWLKMGLLLSSGAKWKSRRRILTPAYHFQILEQFVPIFERVGNVLVDQIRKDEDLDAIDIYPYVTLSTLDVICETAMGVEIKAQLNEKSEYATSVMQMGKIIMDRFIRPFEQSKWTYWLTENYRTERRCLKVIHGHTKSVIANRRQELELKNAKCAHEDDDVGLKKKVAFLDLLLTATVDGKPLTDDDIQEEVDTFMFEGHDTTASAISFALYSIATNSDVQAKLVAEQEEIFGEEKRNATLNDLNKMRYLGMVIKETLRLYPSVPLISRQNKEDLHLGNGITIPRKTTLTLVIFEIQRDPKFFANPDKFDPDRFLTENNLRKEPFSYIPFSAGPRNCIGQKFAILEMKSIISKVLRTFVLSSTVPGHNLELIAETILRSANGMVIKINERN